MYICLMIYNQYALTNVLGYNSLNLSNFEPRKKNDKAFWVGSYHFKQDQLSFTLTCFKIRKKIQQIQNRINFP